METINFWSAFCQVVSHLPWNGKSGQNHRWLAACRVQSYKTYPVLLQQPKVIKSPSFLCFLLPAAVVVVISLDKSKHLAKLWTPGEVASLKLRTYHCSHSISYIHAHCMCIGWSCGYHIGGALQYFRRVKPALGSGA